MDLQIFTDRLLETENLTNDLQDQEAGWLLDWGIQQIPCILAGLEDEEAAGEKVNALMAFMRQVNRLVARKDSRSIEFILTDLNTLSETYSQAFGQARPLPLVEVETIAQRLRPLSPLEAIRLLTSLY